MAYYVESWHHSGHQSENWTLVMCSWEAAYRLCIFCEIGVASVVQPVIAA